MGIIMKNGIAYGASSDEAFNISYDNTKSGLSASNVQNAIDEVSEKLSESGDIDLSEYETKTDSQTKYNDAVAHSDVNLGTAKSYTDEKIANLLNNSTEAVDSIYELRDAMENNADAIEALTTVAASKVPTSRKINNKELTEDITLSADDVGAYSKSTCNTLFNRKVDDCYLEINNNATGTGDVKFATVDYSDCDSNNGASALIRMRSGHGNGKSFIFSQDVYIHVNYDGTVRVDNRKHYDSYVGKYDDVNHQYGDIFWVNDTDNKIVDFYCLVGQWTRLWMTPYKRITSSSKGTFTQYTDRILYSEGAKEWAANSVIVVKSDIPSWAMKSTKPSYTASEVGAPTVDEMNAAIADVQSSINTHTSDAVKHITSDERTAWNTAKTHASSAHAPSNAQANVIESIKVNGVVQDITNKSVNITLPTEWPDAGGGNFDDIYNYEFITVEDIDAICGTTIQLAFSSEVTF